MKKHLTTIILVIILIVGLSLLLYPTVSNYWNSFHQTRAIAGYQDTVNKLDDATRQKMRKKAVNYNKKLLKKSNRWNMSKKEKEEYESILDVSGTGIMGYVEIPSIQVQLPIYHGTDQTILQIAIGHVEGSSLPVGGKGTHTVLSGHRGLNSARLFTDIDQLAEGDIFRLSVLGKTLSYQVDQVRIVLPQEINDLQLDKNKDYCTLVTCTPYGVNTHRLLVRGHRIKEEGARIVVKDAVLIQPLHQEVILTGILLVLYIFIRWIWSKIDWEYLWECCTGRGKE